MKGNCQRMKSNKENREVITTDEIKSILDKYKIGKKPLSKLLGWGETTIIRYIEGDPPTAEYSGKLFEILENPSYYYNMLLQNKNMITEVAYRKSKKAVLAKMTERKIDVVVQRFLSLYQQQVTVGQMQTLLYFAKGCCLAFYDEPLFQEEYKINEANRPYPDISEKMEKGFMFYVEGVDDSILSVREQETLCGVGEAFSWYGTRTLEEILKKERMELKISRDKNNDKIVSEYTIRNHFQLKLKQANVTKIEDIGIYIERLYQEVKAEQELVKRIID